MGTKVISSFRGEYQFLSNFYPVPGGIRYDGEDYPTVEHAYQAAKSLDALEREWIRMCWTPGDAKRAGKKVKLRSDWETVKIPIMTNLLCYKFEDTGLKARLLATGDAILVEGNDWGDTFWGQCRGVGQNHLGRILMEIRKAIR